MDKKRKFDEILSSSNNEVIIDAFVCGYDPMNMVKMGNMILCSHFIMLKIFDKDEPDFIKGPVIVNIKKDTINEVQSYIKQHTQ